MTSTPRNTQFYTTPGDSRPRYLSRAKARKRPHKIHIPKVSGGTLPQRLRALRLWASFWHPGRAFTCEEIGEAVGITRQAIDQITRETLRRLRNPAILRQFDDTPHHRRATHSHHDLDASDPWDPTF